jgi:hypothetical protein
MAVMVTRLKLFIIIVVIKEKLKILLFFSTPRAQNKMKNNELQAR